MLIQIFIFIVTLVGLPILAWLIYENMKHKYRVNELEAQFSQSEKERILKQLEDHRQRIEVLEKIVTDKGTQLKNEIDGL